MTKLDWLLVFVFGVPLGVVAGEFWGEFFRELAACVRHGLGRLRLSLPRRRPGRREG